MLYLSMRLSQCVDTECNIAFVYGEVRIEGVPRIVMLNGIAAMRSPKKSRRVKQSRPAV